MKGYIEITNTTVEPSHYKIKDLNTLIHSVVHTYHPEITEPIKVHYQKMKQFENFFEVSLKDM